MGRNNRTNISWIMKFDSTGIQDIMLQNFKNYAFVKQVWCCPGDATMDASIPWIWIAQVNSAIVLISVG